MVLPEELSGIKPSSNEVVGHTNALPSSNKVGTNMADGTFAVLLLVAGLTDMSANYCGTGTGCLGKTETSPRLALSAGSVIERNAEESPEIYLRYDPGYRLGPFGTSLGLSTGEAGSWIGLGATYTVPFGSTPFYAELHAMPGLYVEDEFDLGGPVAFRSGVELGYEMRNGWRAGLSYDHRSNAGIYDDNPGIETVQFRISVPF